MKIPKQENIGGIVALLPDGRVEYLHPAVKPYVEQINSGKINPASVNFDDFIVTDPLVDLERFHLTAPAIVFIETTNLCNLRCKHCYAFSGNKRPDEMPTNMILKLIDELDDIGVLQVFLTGGEVFSHPDAVQIITHARTKSFSTQIFTNGLLITEEKLAALPSGTSFFISFDTADPTRTIRGGMDFPKLRQCFSWMDKYGHVYRTAISVHRNNIYDAEEIFDWCAKNGYPRPQWLETHPIGRALLHPDMLLQPNDVDRVFEVYKRCMNRYSQPPNSELALQKEDGNEPQAEIRSIDTIKFCQRLERATRREKCARTVAYINSEGDVFPCSNCMSNGAFNGGNLRNASFLKIWQKGFDKFREVTFDDHEVCTECPVNKAGIWCQFRCPPLATNVSKNPLGCGATEYLKLFMMKADQYWSERKKQNIKLTLKADN